MLSEQQTKLAFILIGQVFCGDVSKHLAESSLVALRINVADDASSYCERCPLEAGLDTLEAGLNGHAPVGICLPHQVGLMLFHVPATRKERIIMAFVDAQVLFGNVRRTPMLDKTPELSRKPVKKITGRESDMLPAKGRNQRSRTRLQRARVSLPDRNGQRERR